MITEFTINSWSEPTKAEINLQALNDIEEGKIIFLPSLKFELLTYEKEFLRDSIADATSKNISYDRNTGILRGCQCNRSDYEKLKNMLERFAVSARNLVSSLFPHYKADISDGKTSFRPILTESRKVTSIRKDDSRLHVDSFASQPVNGLRLLRVFSNINPDLPRIWKIGEPFENVVDTFLPHMSLKQWVSPWLLQKLKITKGRRSLYDHLMLQIHNAMKQDDNYQSSVSTQQVSFPSNSSWVVMTDKVSHAALSGQFLLEQIFYVPVNAMQKPELSPLRILERRVGKNLVK